MTCNAEEKSVADQLDSLTRRELLCRSGMGMASLGLAGLFASELHAALDADRSRSPFCFMRSDSMPSNQGRQIKD